MCCPAGNYLTLPMSQDCLFCQIVAKAIPSHTVYEDDATCAFLDINPVNPGHTLIIPKEHYPDFSETPDEVVDRVMRTIRKVAPAVLLTTNTQAYHVTINNGIDAGQVIFHTHAHLIPRQPDDGHVLWGGKPIPEEQLSAIADTIKKSIQP